MVSEGRLKIVRMWKAVRDGWSGLFVDTIENWPVSHQFLLRHRVTWRLYWPQTLRRICHAHVLSVICKASVPSSLSKLVVVIAKSIIQSSAIRDDSSCAITEPVIISKQ